MCTDDGAMTAHLSAKYDRSVPRYTSYPTAPHFSKAVDGGVYGDHLQSLALNQRLSLYFHIPFCASMCWFCGCYTKIVNRYQPVRDYLDVLTAEIDLVTDTLPGRFTTDHLHWGGGSPTMLTGDDWKATLDHLRKNFDIADDAAIAVEVDPRTTTEDYVRALAEAGVNRASMGVQDFDADVQAAINRIQPFTQTERVVDWMRRYGVDNLNLDLMYGLPEQTIDGIIRMVDLAVRLMPARVALFGYAHVPWMKSHQKMIDDARLPTVAERWKQFDTATKRLTEHGYEAIGLDHFAHPEDGLAIAQREGRLRRNFQGYTTDSANALIGFGASAIGALPDLYVQNHIPLRTYSERVGAQMLPVARGFALGADDRLRASVIERLMCDLSADIGDLCQQQDQAEGALDEEIASLSRFVTDGVCEIEDRTVRLTDVGRPLVRLVAAAFDAYLDTGSARHSKAV